MSHEILMFFLHVFSEGPSAHELWSSGTLQHLYMQSPCLGHIFDHLEGKLIRRTIALVAKYPISFVVLA